jgi:hypothetical protein
MDMDGSRDALTASTGARVGAGDQETNGSIESDDVSVVGIKVTTTGGT